MPKKLIEGFCKWCGGFVDNKDYLNWKLRFVCENCYKQILKYNASKNKFEYFMSIYLQLRAIEK